MQKKLTSIFFIIIIILGSLSSVQATELKTKLNVIKKDSAIEYLDDKQGRLEHYISSSDSEKGEITLEAKITNNYEDTHIKERYEDTEIYILVSENIARKPKELSKYTSYIESLAQKVFEKNNRTKIGIIGIKGTIHDTYFDEDGKLVWGENDEGLILGTEDNSEIIIAPTDKLEDINTSLINMNKDKLYYELNLQSAIRMANNNYSNKVNKILICLHDDIPNIAIGVCAGSTSDEGATPYERVVRKHEKIVSRTKAEILNLKDSNVDFILLRPDDTSFDEKWYNTTTGELTLEFDGSAYVQELYGTMEKPTYGKMYSLDDNVLETIVTEYMYNDIIKKIDGKIKSAKAQIYFPEEILNNFDIDFFDNSNVDVTTLQDKGYITWDIGTVEVPQNVILQYTIKIKDMKNTDLLNKNISISKEVNLSYIDYLEQNKTASLSSSPIIQLAEVREKFEEPKTPQTTDETTANGTLPQTGANTIIVFVIISVGLIIILALYRKYTDYKEI